MALLISLLAMPAIQGAPQRPERDTKNYLDDFYMNGQIRCQRCPPGFHVDEHCTAPDTKGTCFPCEFGSTFSAGPTGLDYCLPCTMCRKDQEEVSPCTWTKDRVCSCKNGKYCPPDLPCEMCRTCTPSCQPGLVLKHPCNATADILCEPPSSNSLYIYVIVGVTVVVVILVLLGLMYWKREAICSFLKDRKGWFAGRTCPGEGPANPLLARPTEPPIKLRFKDGTKREEEENLMAKAFYIFVEFVDFDYWDKYMRHLGLNDNLIREAEYRNPHNITEQRHAMLYDWYRSKHFDINELLDTLRSMNLERSANIIAQKLIGDGLFVQTSECVEL
ncbi:tumor necrosis factor receptor superfamily member 10A-like [Spea bombifrons]|uniref:tumor necrosis factor receptor superfamily member 10A-like n=1 Tax=Spea bombifrons TaxID=233779 RepID=UPI002349A830|nr:tumor necrosis factor receptor superfamily member 10A-like [Spea bombifrons]